MERNLLHNLSVAESRMQKLQDMESSGMRFQKPQDDPVGVQRSMGLRNLKARNSQYISNINRAKSWMEFTEQALSEITTVLSKATELALYGGTATTPQTGRDAIADEVAQYREEILALYDRSIEGRTVLVGTMPTWKVGDNVTVTSDSVETLLDDVVSGLEALENALRTPGGDVAAAGATLDTLGDRVLSQRAKNGARALRIDVLGDKLESLEIEYRRLLSDVEDIDLAEVLVKLKSAEVAYQAALDAGARIIQPSLLDYLE